MLKKIGNFSTIMAIGMVAVVAPKVVFAWSEPSSSAPNGNVGAPINTSSNDQVKTGMITAGQFSSNGGYFTRNNTALNSYDSGIYTSANVGAFGLLQATNGANNTGKTLILNYYGGNVGIGQSKTSASQALDVSGYINASSGFCINGTCIQSWPSGGGISGSGTANYLTKWNGASSMTNSIVQDNGTNVGIGMAAAAAGGAKISVAGTVLAVSSGNNSGVYITGDATGSAGVVQGITPSNTVKDLSLNYWGGNVGIGTASPSSKLTVNGDTNIFGNTYFGNSGAVYITSAGAAVLSSLNVGTGSVSGTTATFTSATITNATISGTLTYAGHALGGASRTCSTYDGGGKNLWTAECPAGQYLVSVFNAGDVYGSITTKIKCCTL